MRRGSGYNNAIWCVNVLLALGIFAFAFKYIFFQKGNSGESNLPTGLVLSPNGAISGTPTSAGTWYFSAQVADAAEHKTTQVLSIVVVSGGGSSQTQEPAGHPNARPAAGASDPNNPSIATTSLPNAQVGQPYSQGLQATGGSPPYLWSEDPWPTNPPPPAQGPASTDKGLDEFKTIWESQLVPPVAGPARAAEQIPPMHYNGAFGSFYLFDVDSKSGRAKLGEAVEIEEAHDQHTPVTVNGKKVILKSVDNKNARVELEGDPSIFLEMPILNEQPGTPAGAAPGQPQPEQPMPGKAPSIGSDDKGQKGNQYKVDPKERDFIRANAQDLAKDVRWSLFGVENGKAKGVRIEGFTPGSYAEEYAKKRGIRAGDILLTVNGRTVDGADAANEVFGDDQAWEAGRAQIEVERAGKVEVLHYAVQ